LTESDDARACSKEEPIASVIHIQGSVQHTSHRTQHTFHRIQTPYNLLLFLSHSLSTLLLCHSTAPRPLTVQPVSHDEEEIRLLQLHLNAGVLDQKRKLEALNQINSYRQARQNARPVRDLKSLTCKIFRMQGSERGSSILPAPSPTRQSRTL
jgi:hypothetical protein